MALSKEAMEYKKEMEKNKEEIRKIVLAGVKQADEGKVEDFDKAFDEIEKRYEV